MANVQRIEFYQLKHPVHHQPVAENGNDGAKADGRSQQPACGQHHQENEVIYGAYGELAEALAERQQQCVPGAAAEGRLHIEKLAEAEHGKSKHEKCGFEHHGVSIRNGVKPGEEIRRDADEQAVEHGTDANGLPKEHVSGNYHERGNHGGCAVAHGKDVGKALVEGVPGGKPYVCLKLEIYAEGNKNHSENGPEYFHNAAAPFGKVFPKNFHQLTPYL